MPYLTYSGAAANSGKATRKGAREDFERALDRKLPIRICLQIYQACTEANREADGAEYLERALELDAVRERRSPGSPGAGVLLPREITSRRRDES